MPILSVEALSVRFDGVVALAGAIILIALLRAIGIFKK